MHPGLALIGGVVGLFGSSTNIKSDLDRRDNFFIT
jgi:hypothetical protein